MEAEYPALLAAIEFAGRHPLVIFMACLSLLLLAVGIAVRLLHRYPVEAAGEHHSLRYLLARLMMGFVVIVGCGALFAGLADEIEIDEDLAPMDDRFTQTLASNTPAAAVRIFAYMTHLGDPWMLTVIGIVVAIILLLRRQPWLAGAWAIALVGNALLNPALKSVFTRMRPLDMYGMPFTDGWSFPSGHASGSVVTYGMLAYVLIRNLPQRWHLPIILLAAALAFSVGWSRIFLQFHFGSDVLAGFASGSAWLAVCITTIEALRWQRMWQPTSTQS